MSYQIAVPDGIKIEQDTLCLRLDFYSQSVMMETFEGDHAAVKMVSPLDIAHVLSAELTYNTGMLPKNTLWWMNTNSGPHYAIYDPPQVRTLQLKESLGKKPEKFRIPLPGMVFICNPGKTPWVFAVKRYPGLASEKVYKSPLLNIFENGRACPGNHVYPNDIERIIPSFYESYFSIGADTKNRSKKHPGSVLDMWRDLKGESKYPLSDLVLHGTVQDLMNMGLQ